ncbi:MAG TPA: hypothetical protein ENI22_01465 [Candidatus Pacearchaeota archaeon]|nr:hypothetical protein [Candidatus Pacearchaeota archaeon]
MEENQKKLYDHYMDLSVNGKDDIQKANCLKYAKDILKSFPQFEKKAEEKPAEEEKAPEPAPVEEPDKEETKSEEDK